MTVVGLTLLRAQFPTWVSPPRSLLVLCELSCISFLLHSYPQYNALRDISQGGFLKLDNYIYTGAGLGYQGA